MDGLWRDKAAYTIFSIVIVTYATWKFFPLLKFKVVVWFPMLIFRVEIIYTLGRWAASLWMFCHLDILVSWSVVLLFIETNTGYKYDHILQSSLPLIIQASIDLISRKSIISSRGSWDLTQDKWVISPPETCGWIHLWLLFFLSAARHCSQS